MLNVTVSRSIAFDPRPQRVTESMFYPPILLPPRFLNLKVVICSLILRPFPPSPPPSSSGHATFLFLSL